MESCDITQEAYFHGIEYLITIKGKEESLHLRIEEKLTGNIWKGDFQPKYIEDITQKTGSFKKYPVFVKMLSAAVKQENESVYVDILTPHDLELLKSRKAGNNTSTLSASSQSSANMSATGKTKPGGKRYFILTFTGEFERVHYPLPLSYEENPEPELLKSTVSRLAKELEQLKSRSMTSESGTPRSIKSAKSAFVPPPELVEENEMLKRRLALLESKRIGGAVEMDCLSKEVIEKETGYEKYLKEADRELNTLRSKLDETEKEVEQTKEELFKTKSELGHFDRSRSYTEVETLRSQLGDLSNSLSMERQESKSKIESNKKELNSTMQEMNKYVEGEKRLKVRVKQLEGELEMALKKANYNPNASGRSSKNNTPSRYYSPSSSIRSGSSNKNYSNNSSAKRNNSVPANRANNSSNKRPAPIRTNNYMRQPPQRNAFRPHYSPSSSLRSNSSDKAKNAGGPTTSLRKQYSPNNRLYSPSGAPRNNSNKRIGGTRTMGAVDRISPLRAANQQRPKVPPAVKSTVPAKPSINRTSKSPANRGSVFDRLTGKQPVARPIKEAAVQKPLPKPAPKPAAKPVHTTNPMENVLKESKENTKVVDKKIDDESKAIFDCIKIG